MKKLSFGLLAITMVLVFAGTGLAATKIEGKTVEYSAQGIVMKGYLAYPEDIKEKRPGVLVVHEWWGLNDYARNRAECWRSWDTRLSP